MSARLWRCVAILLAAWACSAVAEDYPSRPGRIVVPFPPGGTVDAVGRVVAQRLTEQTGQTFIVDNRAGAGGMMGSDFVAKAPADGYTLLVHAPTLIGNAILQKSVPYNVLRDFTPVSLIGSVPMLLTVHPGVQASNLREFIALARANPQKYTFGASAFGAPMHLAEESLKREAKLDVQVVTYKGTAPALTDLLGGHISAVIDAIPSTYPHVKSGKLKLLAVTSAQRVPTLPDVPTVAEAGLAGFDMVSWYGLWGPAKLPKEIAQRLAAEVGKAVRSQLAVERLLDQGFLAAGTQPEQFATFVADETTKYQRIIRDANIKSE